MKSNNLITIVTPSYNRGYIIRKLYNSLVQQERLFEWIIVDDGSTDNTKEIVNGFIGENIFPIKYIKKNNGGKHTAINMAMKHIQTPLTMIVDSDDFLNSNAISQIDKYYKKYGERDDIGVFSFLRSDSSGKVILSADNEFIGDYIEYRINGNRPGDMAEVFKTDVLRQYPFPEFHDEKFLSEDVVWIEIAKKYKTIFINTPIYCCEYLPDGLTTHDKPMKFASPLGSMMRGKQLMDRRCGIKANIKGAIIYECFKIETSNKIPEILSLTVKQKILTFILSPLGSYFNKKWKR